MEPFGNRTSRKTDPLAAAISGEQVGNDTVGTELFGSFEESNAKFIHDRDRQFALEERNRVRTDVASNLISYGVATAGDYADFLSWRSSLPHVGPNQMQHAAAVCDPEIIPQIMRSGRLPVSWNLSETGYAAMLPLDRRQGDDSHTQQRICAFTTRQTVGDALRAQHKTQLITGTSHAWLGFFDKKGGLTAGQSMAMISILLSAFGLLIVRPAFARVVASFDFHGLLSFGGGSVGNCAVAA